MAHLDPTKYAVAWIAPLEIEARAALHMLDDRHQGRFPVSRGDDYVYHAGAMGGHNIIIATLPAGQKYGTGSAAALAGQLKKFFPNLWFGLFVGVAAGLPDLSRDPVRDIRLGDVLVGLPEGESAGLLAYDLGKETEDGFQPLRHGHALATTEPIVRSAIGSIKIEAPYDTEKFLPYYEKICDKEHAAGTFSDPGQELDVLFSLDDDGSEITTVRDCRPDSRRIRAWYGPIGSGDKLWKNLRKENELRDKYGLIGLEMEAAGTMDQIPVGVIRGVCDYGDGHKNKIWQPYAAAMAAAYARALLEEIPARAPTQSEIIQAQLRIEGTFRQSKRPEMPPTPSILIPFGRDSDFVQASSDPQSAVDDTIVITHSTHPPCYHVQLAKNPRFTGRTSILNKLEKSFFGNNSSQKVALVGLGGVGKTQIALRFACEMRERRPEYSIFWVPLLSDESAEQAFVEIAKKLGLQRQSNNDDAKALVCQHLASDRAGKWLFIIDNADDGRLISGSMENPGLEEFFPASENGILLMTTRSGHVAEEFAGADVIEVEQMNPKEATELFRKHLTRKKELQDEVLVAKLLSYLSFLPLAITQAASYLNQTKAPLTRYLTLLQDAEKDLPSVLGREFKDTTRYKGSRNAVGKTWIVSFQQIEKSDPIAVRLLSFLSCIEPKDIPQAMIPDAGSEKMEWAVGTLCAYSFLVRQEEIDVLDMHSLVHMATRGWIEERGWRDEALCDAASHLVESFPPNTPANRRLWKKYVPHATRLLDQVTEMRLPDTYRLYELVGRCHSIDRRFKEAAKCYEPVYWWKRAKLREDDRNLLYTEHELARAYLDARRIEDAIEIFEHVVAVQKETLDEKDQSRLASEQVLASAYLDDRRIEDAIEILEHVVAVRKKTLDEKDQSRLASEQVLARAYLDDRRIKDAIDILEHVVAVQKETLDEKDQSRLASEHELARAYRSRDTGTM